MRLTIQSLAGKLVCKKHLQWIRFTATPILIAAKEGIAQIDPVPAELVASLIKRFSSSPYVSAPEGTQREHLSAMLLMCMAARQSNNNKSFQVPYGLAYAAVFQRKHRYRAQVLTVVVNKLLHALQATSSRAA